MSDHYLPIQTILQNKYQIFRYISSGGFGNTYAVKHITLGKILAVKEFFMKGINHRDGDSMSVSVSNAYNNRLFEEQKNKFKKEAKRLSELDNPHIVKVIDLFEENNTVYYVMEYINGCSLREKLNQLHHPFKESEVNNILIQILEALSYIHEKSIMHMDIKPANIMYDKNGKCTLIDFGASKQLENHDGLTTSTAVSYTQGYAPSELVSGDKTKWGAWTDIYSLGATIYNLLTGEKPPMRDDIEMEGIQAFNFPENVSQMYRSLILWMMNPIYKHRPQNVSQIMNYIFNNNPQNEKIESENENTQIETNKNTSNNRGTEKILNLKEDKFFNKSNNIVKKLTYIIWCLFLASVIISYLYEKYSSDTSENIINSDKSETNALYSNNTPQYSEVDSFVIHGYCPDNNHPHAIDMGKAGIWSCCDFGATSPEIEGPRFSWGETDSKNDFSYENYKYFDNTKKEFSFLKHEIANTEYDVIHQMWGEQWHIPSKKEIELLLNKCKHEWTTINDVQGLKFTSENGNSIFIPAYSGLYDNKITGKICSSTEAFHSEARFFALEFQEDTVYFVHPYKSDGFVLRPTKSN